LIPNIFGLQELNCSDCPYLVSIPKMERCYMHNSPWLDPENIKKIQPLQRFIRKNFKYFVFKNWIKTENFAKFFYHPDNFGGYFTKQKLLKI